LDLRGIRVIQLDPVVHFFAELAPVSHPRTGVSGYLPDNVIGDSRAFAELGQVQLLDPAALADVMTRLESVAFAPKKSHCSLLVPASLCSVCLIHYACQFRCRLNSHGCLVSVTPLLARRRGWVLGRTALNAASLLFEIVETISKPVILPSSLDAEFARCDFHRARPMWFELWTERGKRASPRGLVRLQCVSIGRIR